MFALGGITTQPFCNTSIDVRVVRPHVQEEVSGRQLAGRTDRRTSPMVPEGVVAAYLRWPQKVSDLHAEGAERFCDGSLFRCLSQKMNSERFSEHFSELD